MIRFVALSAALPASAKQKKGYDDVAFSVSSADRWTFQLLLCLRRLAGLRSSPVRRRTGENVAYTYLRLSCLRPETRTLSLPIFASENSHSLNSTAPKTPDLSQLRYLRDPQVIPGVNVLKLA